MELAIHGTKGGFQILYSTSASLSVANGDIRGNVNSENGMGKSIYAVEFAKEGCIFTKYSIVRDTLRNYAPGTIAFSLFLSKDKELSGRGADVKSLLDELSNYYKEHYIKNNNINRGEKELIQEDWAFVENILGKYKERQSESNENFRQGEKDAAFIYYSSDDDLQGYFDKPYRRRYCEYKQVFFVDRNLKGDTENPLNSLKHSGVDLTESPTIEQPKIEEKNSPFENDENDYYAKNKWYKNKTSIAIEVVVMGIVAVTAYSIIPEFKKMIDNGWKELVSCIDGSKRDIEIINVSWNEIELKVKSDTTPLDTLLHYKKNYWDDSLAKYKKYKEWQNYSKILDSAITAKKSQDSTRAVEDSIKAYNDSVKKVTPQWSNVADTKPNNESKAGKTLTPLQEEIIAYLNGNEVKKEQLKNYRKKAETQTLEKTIGLYLELWELDGENKTYKDLLSEVKKDANYKSGHIKNSRFVKFLEKESKNEDTKYNKQNAGKFN